MKKIFFALVLISMLCVSSLPIIHAENTESIDNVQTETSGVVEEIPTESEPETDEVIAEDVTDVPSDETEPSEDKSTSALTSDNFKLIVQIPDNGETVVPTVVRFNLFDEAGEWLGNRAIDVAEPGRYEFDFPLQTYEIGAKFKIVATTGLYTYNYYGAVFALNEECIIETYAYRDKNNEPHTCTEGYVVATVETHSPRALQIKEKELHINSNNFQSDTDYLVWVSKANYTVNVFLKTADKWQLIQEFPCSIGAPNTPTVTGQFKYHQYQNKWQYNGYYVGPIMRFYNGYAIHSTLINNNGTDRDGRVGEMISHGCVRVRPESINWLVSYVPLGTKIYVTEF